MTLSLNCVKRFKNENDISYNRDRQRYGNPFLIVVAQIVGPCAPDGGGQIIDDAVIRPFRPH